MIVDLVCSRHRRPSKNRAFVTILAFLCIYLSWLVSLCCIYRRTPIQCRYFQGAFRLLWLWILGIPNIGPAELRHADSFSFVLHCGYIFDFPRRRCIERYVGANDCEKTCTETYEKSEIESIKWHQLTQYSFVIDFWFDLDNRLTFISW